MRRSIAAILAIPTLVNGLVMLVAGPFWYARVPGVTATGPFNPHFIQDIGVAFLVAGLALAARAWRPRYWPAIAGAGFLAAHGLIHLVASCFMTSSRHHLPTSPTCLTAAKQRAGNWRHAPGAPYAMNVPLVPQHPTAMHAFCTPSPKQPQAVTCRD